MPRTLADFEEAAHRSLSEAVWGYVAGGAQDERSLQENRAAFDRWTLRPQMLTGLSSFDLRATVLGQEVRAPFLVAPTAYQGAVHRSAERGTAKAAARCGVPAVFSTLSTDSLESIAEVTPAGPRWFQLYLQSDFAASERLVRRAEAAGFRAIVVTVDTPLLGSRDRQIRSGFALTKPVPVGNGPDARSPPRSLEFDGERYRAPSPADATWEVLDRIREVTRLPLVVKGILSGDDARQAIDHDAAALVVSNHGGRQLDRAPAALNALSEVVDAAKGSAEVYMDGGIRRGSDVLIALALGARAVGLGRPILWALATGGERGVERYLTLLAEETAAALALVGRGSVGELDRSILSPAAGTR
jgi:4-hydroxymandelate oxidase